MKMKTKRVVLLILLGLVSASWVSEGITLEKKTHEYPNQQIAQITINGFSLGAYLKNNLGFNDGAKKFLLGYSEVLKKQTNQRVFEWIGEGGIKEDEPESVTGYVTNQARNNNHFHYPLAGTWDGAGLDIDISSYKSRIPWPFRDKLPDHISGQSSILWAHNKNQALGGKWSWHDARSYFYSALTEKDLDGNVVVHTYADMWQCYSNTFRALGQLMHLVQDASVPAHVRGEFHLPLLFHYEPWLETIRQKESNRFDGFIATPTSLDRSIFGGPPNPLPTISDTNVKLTPVAKLIDTDQYTGTNPEDTWTKIVGLAEFANANFFGEFIYPPFTPKCPFPDLNSSNVEKRIDAIQNPRDPSSGTFRPYYYSKLDDPGKFGYRLATVDFLKDYVTKYFPTYMRNLKPALDGKVYVDYASRLLPRAVSYSAGLLQYFFRGNIEITLPDSGVYAQTAKPDDGFTQVKLKARNTTPNGEEMTSGTIELVVKFKVAQENPFQSKEVATSLEFSYIIVPGSSVQSIPADQPIISRNQPREFVFDLTQTPIPLYATDLYLQVVYKGKLGLEDMAVAVGFKDISEPTPIDIFNDMERICINEGWCVAGDAASQTYGIDAYPHNLIDSYIRLSSLNNPQVVSETNHNFYIQQIAPGTSSRVFILGDYAGSNISYTGSAQKISGSDTWPHIPGVLCPPGYTTLSPCSDVYKLIKNQTDIDNGVPNRIYPTFDLFRGVTTWGGFAVENWPYPANSVCP
jgi:hypothetical protein